MQHLVVFVDVSDIIWNWSRKYFQTFVLFFTSFCSIFIYWSTTLHATLPEKSFVSRIQCFENKNPHLKNLLTGIRLNDTKVFIVFEDDEIQNSQIRINIVETILLRFFFKFYLSIWICYVDFNLFHEILMLFYLLFIKKSCVPICAFILFVPYAFRYFSSSPTWLPFPKSNQL